MFTKLRTENVNKQLKTEKNGYWHWTGVNLEQKSQNPDFAEKSAVCLLKLRNVNKQLTENVNKQLKTEKK